MILTGTLLFALGNSLLRAGVLATPVIAGAPLFVMLVSIAAFVSSTRTVRWLIVEPSPVHI